MQVSLFKNFNEVTENLAISAILEQIRDGRYKSRVLQLRELIAEGKIKEYKKQKKSLPAFSPCGIFEGGRKLHLIKDYSSLIILDIDKLEPSILQTIKLQTSNIPYTYTTFTSPSGSGLKILVRVDSSILHHLEAYNQVKEFYESVLSVPVDPSGKDITRLCFFSYDPDIYINENSETFKTHAHMIEDDIKKVVQQIEQHQLDITNSYQDWVKICFALIDAIGSAARDYFHRISKFFVKYDFVECDKQFDHCLKSKNSGITSKTFFFIAKSYGIDIGKGTYENHSIYRTPKPCKDVPLARLNEPSNLTPSTEEITGTTTPEKPRKKKHATNKFHLVRDYLAEHFDIRYNSVSTEFEYKEKDQEDYKPLNENNIFIKMCLDGLTFSLNNLMAFVKSDLVPFYNPFTQYFQSLPAWDGKTDFIQKLASFVNLKHDICDRFDNHFKKWLVRTVKCAMVDSYFNKQAFILVHDKQNSGKSTFCRFLCPPALSNHIAENLSIDKDSRILLTTNLLINLDELSTLSKVEINSLKSLFSKDKINDRLPYDRKNSIIPRRASFIGSTNQAEFLNDESGSVRWLCFEIRSIDWSYKEKVNIDNVWAQAYTLYKSGFHCDLTPEEIKENEEYNRQFNITTTEYELIHKYLSPGTREHNDCFMTATDILLYLAEQTNGKVKLNNINVGRALKMLSFARDKNYPDKNYGYFVFKKIL